MKNTTLYENMAKAICRGEILLLEISLAAVDLAYKSLGRLIVTLDRIYLDRKSKGQESFGDFIMPDWTTSIHKK